MIKLLFFASIRESIGSESIELDKDGITIKDIKEHIEANYNVPLAHNMVVSINQEYADDASLVNSGDTVAFIPPVGGG